MSVFFRSHPPVAKRIAQTQKVIQEMLKQQPQYVVTTSEFSEVQSRLRAQLNRRKSEPKSEGPTLRRPSERPHPVEEQDRGNQDEDERPTLRRHPESKLRSESPAGRGRERPIATDVT
jgi:hypothetical protein